VEKLSVHQSVDLIGDQLYFTEQFTKDGTRIWREILYLHKLILEK